MEKKTKVALIVAVVVFIIWLWLTIFKCCYKSELDKLIDRYQYLQEQYVYHQEIINKNSAEADEIRETLLNDYWLVFTQAWLEKVK